MLMLKTTTFSISKSFPEDIKPDDYLKVKVTQSCPTLCDPMDCNPPGSSIQRIFPGKNTGVGCYFLLQGIFLTQGLNLDLPHCRQTLLSKSPGSITSKKNCKVKVAQSYPTLCNLLDYPIHGILQARILEWIAFPISRGSSQTRD